MSAEGGSESVRPLSIIATAEERQMIEAYQKASPARRRWLFRAIFCMSNGMDYHAARRVAGPEPPK
jgi:hypothetical protein